MSGHSKWSTIKHKKGALDAKRGKIFTRLIREITISARSGGGDVDGNPRLRTAVTAARAANMPKDNIDKAIKKGTGELAGTVFEEIVYEGYGPSGVAFLVEVVTDNRMRTTPEIRHMFMKYGGSLAESNSVAWMFEKRGYFVVDRAAVSDEDKLLEIVLEAGGEDLKEDGENLEIITPPESHAQVGAALDRAGIRPKASSVGWLPKNTVRCEAEQAKRVLNMFDALEDHDDVQNVYANFDVDDSILEDRE
jgi:YebC/PmpR family DNA-binding regulatory protein